MVRASVKCCFRLCGTAVMDKVTDMRLESLDSSNFVRPRRLKYKQDGVDKVWDLLLARKTVASIIHNKTNDSLVLVRQFRPVSIIHFVGD